MTETTCIILHKRLCTQEVKTWEDLLCTISRATEWSSDAVFVYTEALGDCSLSAHPFLDLVNHEPGKPFEGRIFDAKVEVRWRRLQNSEWRAWTVRECSSKSSEGKPARRIVRKYYLRGNRDKDRCNEFHEARYPKKFQYPVRAAAVGDRAYIEVAEYWRTEPCWNGEECRNIDEMRRTLGEPILFAHRFVGVGAGKDKLDHEGGYGDR